MVLLRKKKKGFTLIEILVALLIFVILMTGVSQIFVSAFSGYRNTRAIQRDLENAQYALNTMAKMLRTSSIASSGAGRVKFYDYSQKLCIEYRIENSVLSVASQATNTLSDCRSALLSSFKPLTTGAVSGAFSVTESSSTPSKRVGKVTVSLEIREGSTHMVRVQSTTSLRDYGNAGL